jgi:flagellar biosynthesis/type III secretory pathway M-ring protein FliF/YscJ
MLNSKCTVCNPSILNVVGALAGLMVFLFVIFAVLFMRAKEEKDDDDADDDNTKGDNNTKKTEKGCCGGQKKHKIRKKKNKLTKEQKIENSRDDTAIS